VTGANIPSVNDLPDVLKPLLDKNVVTIRNFPDFDRDIEKLIKDIRSSQGFRVDDIKIEKFEPKTMFIQAGPFWMGAEAGEGIAEYETPKHEVNLPAYRIGLRPISNKEYEYFIQKTKKQVPLSMGWNGQSASTHMINQPVLGVSWNDAIEYCEWLSNETGRSYSLPNEAQWEKACQEKYDGLIFIENCLEWTSSLWGEKRIQPDRAYYYPWQDDSQNDTSTNRHLRRVMRSVRASNITNRTGRSTSEASIADTRYGFRVVLSA
jgi:formylglycine-generating enzyme required for sulfatase activity